MRIQMALLLVLLFGLPLMSCSERAAETGRKMGTLRYFDLINLDVRDVPLLMTFDALEAQGYRIEKTYLASGTLIADALARGEADLGMVNNQTMWIAIHKGAPVRTLAQFTASTTVIAARQEMASSCDLDGRRLAVASTRGLSPTLTDSYFKEKCGGATPQILVIPESSARAAALVSGEIDATTMPGEELLKLQRETPGKFHALMSYAQEFPDIQIDGLHIRRQWAQENPQLIKDFLRALLTTYREIMANPERLYDEASKRLALDPATAKAISDAHLQMMVWDANGGLTPENIQRTIDFLIAIEALPKGVSVEDVADLSYLQMVLDEIGRR